MSYIVLYVYVYRYIHVMPYRNTCMTRTLEGCRGEVSQARKDAVLLQNGLGRTVSKVYPDGIQMLGKH